MVITSCRVPITLFILTRLSPSRSSIPSPLHFPASAATRRAGGERGGRWTGLQLLEIFSFNLQLFICQKVTKILAPRVPYSNWTHHDTLKKHQLRYSEIHALKQYYVGKRKPIRHWGGYSSHRLSYYCETTHHHLRKDTISKSDFISTVTVSIQVPPLP